MAPPRARLTHFLCLPLVTSASRPQWQASLKKFQDDVNGVYSSTLCPEMIRPPGTIHITIGVLSLPTPEREQAARALLHGADVARCLRESIKLNNTETARNPLSNEETADEQKNSTHEVFPTLQNVGLPSTSTTASTCPPPLFPLITSFSSLQAMGSPTSTSILFAPPTDPESRIRQLCVSVQRIFQAANLMVQENRPLKLHATILNTIYAPKSRRQPQEAELTTETQPKRKKVWRKQFKFDSREILERYVGSEWAVDVRLEKLSLRRMGARKVVVDGELEDQEYEEVDCVPLIVGD